MTVRITDDERRARLVARHHLSGTAAGAVEAVGSVVAMHSSDPASPYLALRARLSGFETTDLDAALYADRALWRLHAMRRTLFLVDRREAPVFDAAVGRAIAERERTRVEQMLEGRLSRRQLRRLEAAVMDRLADGAQLRTTELAEAVPGLRRVITVGSGKWAARVPLSSRLLYVMAMDGRIVRTAPAGSWRSSQYGWAAVEAWFGEPLPLLDPEDGRTRLITRYLEGYGPATATDIRWWAGMTARDVGAALHAAGAVPVALENGNEGFVVKGDLDPVGPMPPAPVFLPGLDSTPMGWKDRSWYLGSHAPALFDRNGNIGPTVWIGGRIVGGWGQRPGGEVAFTLLDDVGAEAAALIESEAGAVNEWLGGVVIKPRFRTPIERELAGSG
jgi:hypothetical protein